MPPLRRSTRVVPPRPAPTTRVTRATKAKMIQPKEDETIEEKLARYAAEADLHDNLTVLPTPATSVYVKNGRINFDDRYVMKSQRSDKGKIGINHPKILKARQQGVPPQVMAQIERNWEYIDPSFNPPLAGLPAEVRYPDRVPHFKSGQPGAADTLLKFEQATRVFHCKLQRMVFNIQQFILSCGEVVDEASEDTSPLAFERVFAVPRGWFISSDKVLAPRAYRLIPDSEDNFHNRPSINIPLPDHMKALLVDDWENVTKNQQLVPLPHAHPVSEILDDYLAYERPHREEGSSAYDILDETVSGLREYFDRCLGRILLYRFERGQYHEMHQLWNSSDPNHTCASDTYGAEHLTRLLVSLPELIAQTNMDRQSVNRLRDELETFTKWFSRQHSRYFVNEYEQPGNDYVDAAKST